MTRKPSLYSPWRRLLQISISAVIFIIPFVKLKEESLLRLDIPTLTLHLAGNSFRIEELYIFWMFTLCFIFIFVLSTIILGRVWCGWLCPQTAYTDLIDFIDQVLKRKRFPDITRKLFKHFFSAIIGLFMGTTFVLYFIEPGIFLNRLLTDSIGPWAGGSIIVVGLIIYFDQAFLGRLFCKEFCPYGRFQTIITDSGTLTLQAHPRHIHRCIDCKACVKVCPTGIDIRKGFQIECINCAKCIDACEKVMAAKNQESIIHYTFGNEDKGWRSLINAKVSFISLIVIIILFSSFYSISQRKSAILKIARSHTRLSKITADNQQLSFFSGSLINRLQEPSVFDLKVMTEDGKELKTRGVVKFTIRSGEKKDFNLAVISHLVPEHVILPIKFIIFGKDGKAVFQQKASLTGVHKEN